MRRTSLALLAVVAAAAVVAACGPAELEVDLEPEPVPPSPFGRAIDGDLIVTATSAVDNQCVPLISSAPQIELGETPPADWSRPGRRVFLQQVTGAFTESSSANLTSDPGRAGFWEIAPIASVDGSTVELAVPAIYDYSTDTRSTDTGEKAQACIVREYGMLTLQTSLEAAPWSGSAGGVLVFFVRDGLVADTGMTIRATGAGFAGGDGSGESGVGTTTFDTSAVDGGYKGAGIDTRSQSLNGRGAYRNAGGGGNANRGGGGGGAGFGFGGKGGNGITGTSGGLAGVALDGDDLAPSRIFFGGGGGAGHAASGATAGRGGNGGGVIVAGARVVVGTARLVANGLPGFNAVTGAGAGGGGAGGAGTVVFWVSTANAGVVTCEARGLTGGNSLGAGGKGGGGGGGACWTTGTANVMAATNGAPGVSGDPGAIPDWCGE